MNGRVRLYRWFAADAVAEGHENPLCEGHHCPTCGTRLDSATRPCPFAPHDEDGAA